MIKKAITPPEIPDELFDVSDEESFFMELYSREPFDACEISGINTSEKNIDGFSGWGCLIKNCRFVNASAYRGEFYDTTFKNCDFSGCDMTESVFKRCRFINCKGVGFNLSRGNFMDVSFESCMFEYANFSSSRLNYVGFWESCMKNCEIKECTLSNIELSETNFNLSNFSKTPLKGIDFTDCEFEGIMVSQGFSELKGAIVTSYQASGLASLMGLDIR